jgi:hypothetical protein
MKKLLIVALLILFSLLLYITQGENFTLSSLSQDQLNLYSNGILKSEEKFVNNITDYDFAIEFSAEQNQIFVKEKIVWRNKTNFNTDEIQFHLYANAYKSTNTNFAKGYDLSSPESKTEIKIQKFLVNDKEADLIFIHPETMNTNDSTVAKTELDKVVEPGDSVNIYFEYTLKIPKSVKRLGYARGRNFYFISQWFPKVGVFENGEWICSPYYPYLNFYSNFGTYSAKIIVPAGYQIASTGVEIEKISNDSLTQYHFVQNGIHDFAWLATDNILHRNSSYRRKDGSEILIQTYVQPEREKYFERYIDAVKNSLEFFEDHVGIYPYQNISLVDVPRTSNAGGMEYPTLFTVSAELFSPKATGWPEYLVAHEFSHQFFQGVLANNEVYEAWLDEGFASYFATKIMFRYYPDIYNYFKFATYIPIYGLDFFSYREIPIIYTLAEIQIPEGTQSLASYYSNKTIGSITDTSYKQPTRLAYVVNTYSKPELVFHSLERYLGFDKMMSIMKYYFMQNKFKHPTANDFFNSVKKNVNEDMDWFFEEFFRTTKIFDYRVTSVIKKSDTEYEVLVERLRDGIFKNDIYLYTDKEILKQKWDGKEHWKTFTFKTSSNVIAAEIDPHRKNLLDINFSNNSYTVDSRIWASWSLAIRVFFWVQNALMIMGSIG